MPSLAQGSAELAFNEMLPWLGALLAAALLAGIVLFYLRHRLLGTEDTAGQGRSFLEELRDLRDRGEISDDEYEQARLTMIAKATGKSVEDLRRDAILKAGGRVAQPGYDLTGRPLPNPVSAKPAAPPRPTPTKPRSTDNPDQGPATQGPPE